MANKVKFNLKNVYYSKVTETVGTSGTAYSTWTSTVYVPS